MGRHRRTTPHSADLAADLDILLADLCRHLGFCNRLTGLNLASHHPCLTADAFATAILTAEGMNPELEKAWHRKIKRVFLDRYGEAVSRGSPSPLSRGRRI